MKLKKQYEGLIITRGKITFNTINPKPENPSYYFDNGFSDLFEEEELIVFIPKKKGNLIVENQNLKNNE